MSKTIKYIGTQTRWSELAVTGKQSTWSPDATDERSDTEAAQLLATGQFSDVDATLLPEPKVVALSGVVSGAGNGRGLRTVILGDSFAAYNNIGVSISSITLSGGVITVVTGSSHQMRDGQNCNVSGTTNSTFHGRLLPVTWISGTSFSYPAPDGATGTATSGGVLCQNQLNSCGDWVHTNARLGGRMRLVANLGIGGETSTAILARISEAWALSPDVLWLNAGTNDVIQDVPYATIVANIESMVSQAASKSVLVVLKTLPPFASGGAFHSAARNANLLNVNQFIRRLATRYRGVYVLDLYRALISPTDANGYGATAYYQASDSVHYGPRGAARAGALGATLLSSAIPAVDNRVTSITDNYGSNAANRDLHDRAPWTNTGGTVNAPATGAVGAGWIVDSSASWSVAPAVSMVSRSDGLGFDITVTGTPGAAGNTVTVRTDSTAQNARLPSFVGKTYRWVCEVTITNAVASGLRMLEVYNSAAIGSPSGTLASALAGLSQAGFLSLDSDAATTLTLASAEFLIPSGAVTNCSMTVKATMDAASATALTFTVGSVRMQPMDDV